MRKVKNPPVEPGAVPADELKANFPDIKLPIQPPYPPMEAKSVDEIPLGNAWIYEPKWDGFRCVAFRSGDEVLLQSKAGQPLGRYFPELLEELRKVPQEKFVLDGEIVIFRGKHLSFDDLLMRIHPAESRIRKLSKETPASLLTFDLLVENGKSLVENPLRERREKLEEFFRHVPKGSSIRLSPSNSDHAKAEHWMRELAGSGFDGVIAKRTDAAYASGERTGMVKIKNMRTADVVVGGFRYATKGNVIGSMLLGLYDDHGELNHVGFTSSFTPQMKKDLKKILEPLRGGEGFTGNAPGGPSRWSTERSAEWERLDPKLVCEVQFDHFSQGRFRHGTKFLRWRPEKSPKQCTYEQLEVNSAKGLEALGLKAA
ncbi:MAG TPA: ATP-dependent DNA ligase [Terriglobales bacterium]|nr:ATP-dependent DNA ligase [Terriglobales bacterium]